MEDARWHNYFSENIRKFRSGGVGFIGLFVSAEAMARVVWPSWFAAMSPVLDLLVFGLCFTLYWRFERRLDELPDRGWSVSRDRGEAELEVGRRGHAKGLAMIVVILSICVILLFAPDRGLGTIFVVAAAWLGLHRARAQDMWGHLSVAFWGFAVIGPLYLMMPQYDVDGGAVNMLVLSEFGVVSAVLAVADHRMFVRHVGLRSG